MNQKAEGIAEEWDDRKREQEVSTQKKGCSGVKCDARDDWRTLESE